MRRRHNLERHYNDTTPKSWQKTLREKLPKTGGKKSRAKIGKNSPNIYLRKKFKNIKKTVKKFGSKNAARTMVKNVLQYAPNNKNDKKKRCAKFE